MKNKKQFCFVPIMAMLMMGCESLTSKPHEESSDGSNGSGKTFELSQMFDSSFQKDDPYTVENMQKALDSLVNSKPQSALAKATIQSAKGQIKPNFMYVRFLPKGRKQKDILRHTGLVLWEYPLDYKEENRWKGWVDKTLPDSVQAFYTSVPIGYSFDEEIEYYIIKKLFIPQPIEAELDSIELAGGSLKKATAESKYISLLTNLEQMGITLSNLEIASRNLTGNLNKETQSSSSNVLAKQNTTTKAALWSRWRPKGTLKFRDTEKGDVPVEGVRVTAGYSYYWRSSKTDVNGYFVSPERWTYSVKYEAHWDTDDFLLEDGESWYGADLYTEGPTTYSDWNRTFLDSHARAAIIFTAAYYYYYKNIDGLARPRQNGWVTTTLDIEVYEHEKAGYAGVHSNVWFINYIEIRNVDPSGGYYSSKIIYGITLHELAHSAHYETFNTRYPWMLRGEEFNISIQSTVKESYAAFCEWYLINKRYPNSKRPFGYFTPYTSVFQDLVDTDTEIGTSGSYKDRFGGVTIGNVNWLISNSFYWSELRANAASLNSNASVQIMELFDWWNI